MNYLGVAVGFITTFFVLTNYLTSEEVGLTRVLVDAAVLFASFAQVGTASSIIRFFPYFKDETGKNHGFFFWTLIVPVVGFLLFLLVLTLFKQPIIGMFEEKSPLFTNYFRFVIPLTLFMLYQSVFEANANVLMRIVVPKLVREVGVRVGLLACYLLYGAHIITFDGLVVGFCITYGLAMLTDVVYLFTLQKISLKPDFKFITKPLARDFILYSLMVTLSALAANTPLLSSFFVSAKMGLAFTGIFAIANYIATVIEIPNRSLNAITGPNIAEAVKNEDWARANTLMQSVSLHLMLSSLFIFFIIWINVDLLFLILPNGGEYVSGKSVIFILGLARLTVSVFGVSLSALNFSKYYGLSLVFMLVMGFMVIVLNMWLIPPFGINGSAMASLGSYLVYYFCILVVVRWKLKVSIFSKGQLKVLVIVVGMYLINILFTNTLSPMFAYLPGKALFVAIVEGGCRTLLLLAIGVAATYFWKVSPEVNMIIERVFKKK